MAEETKRVELSDGGWAEVRTRAKLRDAVDVIEAARERGFEDDYMNAMVRLQVRIVDWSYGPVTLDRVLDLYADDATVLFGVINGEDAADPNSSSPSPSGTRRTRAKSATTEENRPGNGK